MVGVPRMELVTLRCEQGVCLERPDGYFARCYAPSSSSQPWLYCSVREKLTEDVTISQ
jgi:hypothetical protein